MGADRWDGEQGRRSVRGRVRTLRRMHAVGWSPGSEKRKNRPTLVGDTLTRFCLAGCADFTVSFSFTFTFRQRNQCKRERWDRILAQVTFLTKFRAPPLSASLSAGERGGYNLVVTRRCIRSIQALYNTISTVLSTHTTPSTYTKHMQVI